MKNTKEKLNKLIKVSEKTKKRLDDYKIYDRETYNDAIKRAINNQENKQQEEK